MYNSIGMAVISIVKSNNSRWDKGWPEKEVLSGMHLVVMAITNSLNTDVQRQFSKKNSECARL